MARAGALEGPFLSRSLFIVLSSSVRRGSSRFAVFRGQKKAPAPFPGAGAEVRRELPSARLPAPGANKSEANKADELDDVADGDGDRGPRYDEPLPRTVGGGGRSHGGVRPGHRREEYVGSASRQAVCFRRVACWAVLTR